jgi:hypothetical protein
MRKLCIDEVGRVKMKKNEKKESFVIQKIIFCLLFFFGYSFGFALKDDL